MVVEKALARRHYSNFICVPTKTHWCLQTRKWNGHRVSTFGSIHEGSCRRCQQKPWQYFRHSRTYGGNKRQTTRSLEEMEVHSILGLVKMGGIGKTALSKKLYNCEKKRKQFEKFSFLEDIKSRGSEASCKQLYHDLCGKKWDDDNVNM